MPKFLTWGDLAERRTTSKSTEKRRVGDDPRHPRPVQVSPGRVAFPEPEVEAYDLLLIAERDAEAECIAAERYAEEADEADAEKDGDEDEDEEADETA